MSIALKQSTASQEIPLGPFLDATDGNTAETGLTIANTDIKLWKTGATSLANKNSGGATHMAQGVYSAVLDATDTDTLGPLVIFVHVAGALAVRLECTVLTAANYNAAIAGTAPAAADVTHVGGAAIPAPAVSGVLNVNVTHAAGTAWGAGAITANSVATAAAEKISDTVWDEQIDEHLDAGSTGAALNGAGAAGDPWTTPLPGAYGAGTAGNIVGTRLDLAVSTRLAGAGYTVPPSAGANAAAVRTELATELGRIDAAVSTRLATAGYTTPPTAIQNADALLGRDLGSGSGAGSLNERTVRSALRWLRNKWGIASGTLTVCKEDDTTTAWTSTMTQTAGNPTSGSDPS